MLEKTVADVGARVFFTVTLALSAYSWVEFTDSSDTYSTYAMQIAVRLFFVFAVGIGLVGSVFHVNLWWGGENWCAHSVWIVGNVLAVAGGSVVVAVMNRQVARVLPDKDTRVCTVVSLIAWLAVMIAFVVAEGP